MVLEELRERVFEANRRIVEAGLVVLTFGNASAIDRASGVDVIKPSGVPYEVMTERDLVAVDVPRRHLASRFASSCLGHDHEGRRSERDGHRRPIVPAPAGHRERSGTRERRPHDRRAGRGRERLETVLPRLSCAAPLKMCT